MDAELHALQICFRYRWCDRACIGPVERPICQNYSQAMKQFLAADDKRQKLVDENEKNLEQFTEDEWERKAKAQEREKEELEEKNLELEAEVRSLNQRGKEIAAECFFSLTG